MHRLPGQGHAYALSKSHTVAVRLRVAQGGTLESLWRNAMSRDRQDDREKDDGRIIFRKSITTPDGEVIYAEDYGYKAFPIQVSSSSSSSSS